MISSRRRPPAGIASLKKFKKIYIEITNHCNLACSFCHRSQRPQAFMSPSTFAAVIRQLEGFTEHLYLHVLGEPLLHPDLAALLDLCHHQGLRVNLTTNGTLLERCQAVLLGSAALRQVNISLHSFEEMAGEGLNSYLDEILDFVRLARASTALLINLRLWKLPPHPGSAEVEAHYRIIRRLETCFPQAAPIRVERAAGQGITLAPGVFLSQAPQFTWPHASRQDFGERGACRGLKDHLAILVDGTVVPCCLDAEADIPLGNILQTPLAHILSSPRATALSQGFSQRRLVESLCRRCSFRQRF